MTMLNIPDNTLYIDNSSIELITICPFLAYATLIRRRVPAAPQPALRFGRHIHSALEYRYKCMANSIPFDENHQATELSANFANDPCDEEGWRNADTARDLISAYNTKYPNEDLRILKVNGEFIVEKSFTIFTGRIRGINIIYTGRIDLAYYDGPHVFVRDHKTSSVLGDTYWKDAAVSEQQRGYCYALREALGVEPLGYELNVLAARAPTKTGKSLELPPRFKTFTKEPTGQLDAWRDNMMNQLDVWIYLLERNGDDFTKWAASRHHKNCITKYGPCRMYSVCELPDHKGQEFALMSSAFKVNDWNPLETK